MSMVRNAILLLAFVATELTAAPLFEDDAVIDFSLRGPLSTLIADTEDRTASTFTLETPGYSTPVKVRLRGHSRLRVCEFPPLRLDFRKMDTQGSIFESQGKLKLVTHCRNYDRAEQDLLEEYAAYRIFNVLTDLSYRVRLLRISYDDTDGKLSEKASPRYGFVLETADQLAERVGAEPATLRGVPKKRHDREQAALMYVYQYLIANTDWGLVKADYDAGCCHNVDLFERDSQVVTVPYDLDLSGLVNANYAFPDKQLRIKKVTQRLYRGLCTDPGVVRTAIDRVTAREGQILDVLRNTPGLSDKNRQTAITFLGRFFKDAANGDKLVKHFERRCIGK